MTEKKNGKYADELAKIAATKREEDDRTALVWVERARRMTARRIPELVRSEVEQIKAQARSEAENGRTSIRFNLSYFGGWCRTKTVGLGRGISSADCDAVKDEAKELGCRLLFESLHEAGFVIRDGVVTDAWGRGPFGGKTWSPAEPITSPDDCEGGVVFISW